MALRTGVLSSAYALALAFVLPTALVATVSDLNGRCVVGEACTVSESKKATNVTATDLAPREPGKRLTKHPAEQPAVPGVRVVEAFSFRATSSEAACVPNKLDGRPHLLRDIIGTNRAVKHALPEGHGNFVLEWSGTDTIWAYEAPAGLVSAIVVAYKDHHELVLRPDDLWQAILTQFSFYVQGRAEQLRDRFVDFQGKRELEIDMDASLLNADYATFAHRMVHEQIVPNIKDPSVVDWLLPSFSTTTWNDRVAASVTLMSTLQGYFMWTIRLACGIPKVTLLGTVEDWANLRRKIDRFLDYDLSDGLMKKWHSLLASVLEEFLLSAAGAPSMPFWDTVCSVRFAGSGDKFLSGWATVFALFKANGAWQGSPHGWPEINFQHLPVGAVSVPVSIKIKDVPHKSHMLAGQFAYEGHGTDGVALKPRTDWCLIMEDDPEKQGVSTG